MGKYFSAPAIDPAHFRKILWQVFFLPIITIVALIVLLSWMGANLFRQADLTDRSDQVMAQTYACRRPVIDMEAGLRGFQVTGDERFLESYRAAETNIVGEFDKLEKLISDNPRQTERLKAIRTAFDVWHEFATDMRLRRERGGDFQEGAANLRGKALMDATRDRFDEFISDETRLRQERNEKTVHLKKYFMGTRLGLGLSRSAGSCAGNCWDSRRTTMSRWPTRTNSTSGFRSPSAALATRSLRLVLKAKSLSSILSPRR